MNRRSVSKLLKAYSERKELVGMAQRGRTVALGKYLVERALREYRKVLSSS